MCGPLPLLCLCGEGGRALTFPCICVLRCTCLLSFIISDEFHQVAMPVSARSTPRMSAPATRAPAFTLMVLERFRSSRLPCACCPRTIGQLETSCLDVWLLC